MPNVFSIKNGILYYNVEGEDDEEDVDMEMPEDVEEEEGEPEAEVQPENNEEGEGSYVTYADVLISKTPSTTWATSPMLSEKQLKPWHPSSPLGAMGQIPGTISHCHSEPSSLGLKKPKLGEVVDTTTSMIGDEFIVIKLQCGHTATRRELSNTRVGFAPTLCFFLFVFYLF